MDHKIKSIIFNPTLCLSLFVYINQLIYSIGMQTISQSIHTFDQSVLQDQLLRILQRSPQTQRYVGERVQQIIAKIMSDPFIQELHNHIAQLQVLVGELEEQKQSATISHTQQSSKSKNMQQRYAQRIRQLEAQLSKAQNIRVERDNFKIGLATIEKQNKSMHEQSKQLKHKYDKIVGQLKQSNQLCEQLKLELAQMDKQNAGRIEQNKSLQQQIVKLKKMCKQTKYNEISFKKEAQRGKQECQSAQQQICKLKEQLRVEKVHRDNQRKALGNKLAELHKKAAHLEKAKKKITVMGNHIRKMQEAHTKLREYSIEQIRLLSQECQKYSHLIMDEIGEEVNKELKHLMNQMSKNNAEVRIYRQQVKIKDEIIQKLEKVSSVQVMGNRELQKQLKSKKMEADTLRKQLKRNYEQSQIRFMGLENSYRQILTNSINHPIR